DLTQILTMERQPLALELAEEVVVCLEKEDKLKVIALMAKYNKVLTDVRIAAQTMGVAYDHCVDQDKVTSILLTSNETELKEFREKNKGNRVKRERIISEVEKKSEAIEN
ncbi:hypothetical protein KI387_029823, partial [Taxus chinensis]